MTCSTLLTVLPLALGWLGPAEAPETSEATLTTVDPTAAELAPSEAEDTAEGSDAAEGDAAAEGSDAAEGNEAAPPGPDPAWTVETEATAEQPEAPAETAPAPASAPVAAPPVLVPPPPARPIRWRLDFGIGGGSTVAADPGVRAFSSNRGLPELSVSSVFDFRLAQGRVFLGGGLSYQRVSRDGSVYGSLVGTELVMHEPEVLGRVSVMALEGIDAFAQAGVGPSFTAIDVSSGSRAEQRGVLPRVDGHAGLSLYLPKKWLPRKQANRLTAGLQLGAGYTWRGRAEVQPLLLQDDDPLRASSSSWGDLRMHGFSWRVGVFLRLM